MSQSFNDACKASKGSVKESKDKIPDKEIPNENSTLNYTYKELLPELENEDELTRNLANKLSKSYMRNYGKAIKILKALNHNGNVMKLQNENPDFYKWFFAVQIGLCLSNNPLFRKLLVESRETSTSRTPPENTLPFMFNDMKEIFNKLGVLDGINNTIMQILDSTTKPQDIQDIMSLHSDNKSRSIQFKEGTEVMDSRTDVANKKAPPTNQECNLGSALKRKTPDEICANKTCTQRKFPKCTEQTDSEDSLDEDEKPLGIRDYFKCHAEDCCVNTTCYPCTLSVNNEVILKYAQEYQEMLENNPEKRPKETCVCNDFRKFYLNKMEEKKMLEAIANCPCPICTAQVEELKQKMN